MSRIMSPWELAYTKLKEHYSKDQIDDMLWCEVEELLTIEERNAEGKQSQQRRQRHLYICFCPAFSSHPELGCLPEVNVVVCSRIH